MNKNIAQDYAFIDSESANNPVVTTDSNGLPLSYKYSDTWDFSHNRLSKPNARNRIYFSTIPFSYRHQIQDLIYNIYKQSNITGISHLAAIKEGLAIIAECLYGANWEHLSSDLKYREFKQNLIEKKLSQSSYAMLDF